MRTAPSSWKKTATNIIGLQNALTHLYTELQAIPKKPEEVHAMSRRVDEVKVQLGFIMEAEQKNTVFWIERRGESSAGGAKSGGASRRRGGQHNVFLQATPIDRLGNSAQYALREP